MIIALNLRLSSPYSKLLGEYSSRRGGSMWPLSSANAFALTSIGRNNIKKIRWRVTRLTILVPHTFSSRKYISALTVRSMLINIDETCFQCLDLS